MSNRWLQLVDVDAEAWVDHRQLRFQFVEVDPELPATLDAHLPLLVDATQHRRRPRQQCLLLAVSCRFDRQGHLLHGVVSVHCSLDGHTVATAVSDR